MHKGWATWWGLRSHVSSKTPTYKPCNATLKVNILDLSLVKSCIRDQISLTIRKHLTQLVKEVLGDSASLARHVKAYGGQCLTEGTQDSRSFQLLASGKKRRDEGGLLLQCFLQIHTLHSLTSSHWAEIPEICHLPLVPQPGEEPILRSTRSHFMWDPWGRAMAYYQPHMDFLVHRNCVWLETVNVFSSCPRKKCCLGQKTDAVQS